MSGFALSGLAGPLALLGLAAHLAAGFAVGVVYFLAIWRSANRLAAGASRTFVLAATAGRIALLVGSLTLASREGAPALLTLALGLLIARAFVLRKLSGVAS